MIKDFIARTKLISKKCKQLTFSFLKSDKFQIGFFFLHVFATFKRNTKIKWGEKAIMTMFGQLHKGE